MKKFVLRFLIELFKVTSFSPSYVLSVGFFMTAPNHYRTVRGNGKIKMGVFEKHEVDQQQLETNEFLRYKKIIIPGSRKC